MDILIPSLEQGHEKSGIGNATLGLIKALAANSESDVRLCVIALADELSLFPEDSAYFKKIGLSSALSRPLWSILWHQFCLQSKAKSFKDLILHLPSHRRPVPAGLRPRVVTVHDVAPLKIARKYGCSSTLLNWYMLYSSTVKQADAVIVPSSTTRQDLLEMEVVEESRIHVIPQGVDCGLFRPLCPSKTAPVLVRHGIERPYLFYISRIEHPGKNHLALIQAFEDRQTLNERFDIVFAGADCNGSHIVREHCRKSRHSKRIHFLGFVPKEDIPALYSAAFALVFPSLYEGFGLPVIEALACGTRVICAQHSALSEFAPLGVDFLSGTSPKEIGDSLERLTLTGDYAGQAQERHQLATTFSWSSAAQKTLSVYRLTRGAGTRR